MSYSLSHVPGWLYQEWAALGKTPAGFQVLQRQLLTLERDYQAAFNARHPTTAATRFGGNTPSDLMVQLFERREALCGYIRSLECADRAFLRQRTAAAKVLRKARDKKRKTLAQQRRHAR